MDDDELLISKPEVYLYEIPSQKVKSGGDHRAADWDIANPTWQGKILIFMAGSCCHVQLDDHQGNIYGQAVIDEYPGSNLKLVSDSRRYFTLNVQNVEGNFRLVGIGFSNREDSSEISNVLRGYFAAEVCRKRKLEKSKIELSEASPPKKLKSNVVESIFSQTNDPEYKYIVENSFQCHECPMSFNCPKLIVHHWSKIHKRKKACLCLCKLPYPNRGERNTHFEKFHDDAFPCVVCRAPFQTDAEVVEHLLSVHNLDAEGKPIEPVKTKKLEKSAKKPADFRCSHCNLDCFTKFQLIRHFQKLHRTQVTCKSIIEDSEVQKISSNGVNNSSVVNSAIDKYKKIDPSYEYITGNLFQCHKCAEAFENVPSFSEHWKHVHALKVIHCRCKLIFPSLEQQRTHEKEIHNFVCCVCNIRFVSGFALEDHLLTSHLCDYTGKIINSLDSTKIQCEHCEDWFCFRQQLQMHVKLKHSKRSDTNNDSKALKSSIVPVDSSEDPEKPKPLKTCKVCGVIVSNKKERQTHYRLHKLATVTSKGGEAESNRIEGTHGEYSKEVAEENVNAVADGQHASDVADGQSMNEFADGQNLRKFANGENPNFADDDYTNGNVDGQNANFAVDEYGNDVVDGENANFADDEYANDVVGGENANFADDEYTNDVVDGENADEFADEEYVNDVYDEEYTNEVYDEEYTNEVYDEEYANEVEDDFTNEVDEVYVSEFADEENQNEVVDEETRTKIADEETRTKIADEETRTKIADEETRTKIADEENPAKIADEETPPKIVDEETRTKIADEENPAKIADEETPTKIADEENSANC